MRIKKNVLFILMTACIVVSFIVSCIPSVKKDSFRDVLEFEQGIRHLARELNIQFVKNDSGIIGQLGLAKKTGKKAVLLDPFVDANSAQELTINSVIENIIAQELNERFDAIKMGPGNVKQTSHILSGIISYETSDTIKEDGAYHVYAMIFEKDTGIIKAGSDVWIKSIDFKPLAVYSDSPVFLKDKHHDKLVSSVKSRPGERVDNDYLKFLETKSLIVKADYAYEKKEYRNALKYYDNISKRNDGATMKVFSALYSIYRKLGNMNKAEQSFGSLIGVSVNEKKQIDVKLLFKVNSPYFTGNQLLAQQYSIWLRQIGKYMKKSPYCLNIIGHCSRTGKADYNIKLSKRRARTVQNIMAVTYPGIEDRSNVIGRGFSDYIVGSGTDDARDAIDRRVEFKIVECNSVM